MSTTEFSILLAATAPPQQRETGSTDSDNLLE